MRYNFHCLDCKVDFRKDAKLSTIKTEYGDREGIKCPLCKGRAKALGVVVLTLTTNGEFNTVGGKNIYVEL